MSSSSTHQIQILHVLTLSSSNGSYGGPTRVARELCSELQNRGHIPEIFSGVISGFVPHKTTTFKESFVIVRPFLRRFSTSTLWSIDVFPVLYKRIKQNELVHIHFARELVPLAAAIICIFTKTAFITQTHGMLVSDKRWSVRILDSLVIKRIINHSKVNLVLSEHELRDVSLLNLKTHMKILPNGIKVFEDSLQQKSNYVPEIAFCSRLQSRKRVDLFLSIAKFAKAENIGANFSIYGPDGGELSRTLNSIELQKLSNVRYMGSVQPEFVSKILAKVDLLVLPSENEPFPMIVLESLSVGTSVLIMPSCGIASLIGNSFPEMVALEESEEALRESFLRLIKSKSLNKNRIQLREFCSAKFGISPIVTELEKIYSKAISC